MTAGPYCAPTDNPADIHEMHDADATQRIARALGFDHDRLTTAWERMENGQAITIGPNRYALTEAALRRDLCPVCGGVGHYNFHPCNQCGGAGLRQAIAGGIR